MVRLGPLRVHLANIPVDGWLPHVTGYRIRDGARWLIEWRRLWIWWGP